MIAGAVALWCLLCLWTQRWLIPELAARCGGDAVSGFLLEIVRLYTRALHRVTFTGCEEVRMQTHPGPLVIVSNHTAGVDPLLLQSGMRGHVRWLMQRRMMTPALNWLWKRERVIPVDFDSRDVGSARCALRHLQARGVLGIFPEGGLARPPETIQPFFAGVGLIVARSKAPVLLCWISGTPQCATAYASLMTPSRSSVRFLELLTYPPRTRPEVITDDLRRRLSNASGWPLSESVAATLHCPAS